MDKPSVNEREKIKPDGNRIQISGSKKPFFAYVALVKRLLREQDEVHLSALGHAIYSAVTVSEILRQDRLTVTSRVTTGVNSSLVEGRGAAAHKPQILVTLRKSPEFDSIVAAEDAASAARDAAAPRPPEAPAAQAAA